MNKDKFIILDDLVVYTLREEVLNQILKDYDIKIYDFVDINKFDEDTPLKPTNKNLLVDEVEYVRIRIPKGIVQKFNKNNMKNYKMTTIEATTDNEICTADRTLIQLPYENFIELLLEYKNPEMDEQPNPYNIHSLFHYTIANDSIELLDKYSRTICYVLDII